MDKGLINAILCLSEALDHPFSIQRTDLTLKTIGIFLIVYALAIGMYLSSAKNYRRTEEYGSAKWAIQILYVRNTPIKSTLPTKSFLRMYEWD